MPTRLAIDGGEPAFVAGPPAWPFPSASVEAIVAEAMASGAWGKYHGPYVDLLSSSLAETFGVGEALPCCSGTVAVELALRGLRIGSGDEVLLSGYDFPGNFRCIEALGAKPVLVDVDPQTSCLDADRLRSAVSSETRAMIVSHLHGGIAPMRHIMKLADELNLHVVEDACQCPGAVVDDRPAGSWGHAGVLSFGGSKLLTSGRGGAVLTSDAAIAQRIRVYRDRGNDTFPLSQLQAALLLPQLEQLGEKNGQRASAVERLRAMLTDIDQLKSIDTGTTDARAAYYKVGWILHSQVSIERFVAAMQAEGVAMDRGFRGFVKRSAGRCRHAGPLPHATVAAARTVILHHPILLGSQEDIATVGHAIRKVCGSL